jgi:hypothetical protein
MDNITIPPEALEAACRAYTEIMLDVAPESAIEAAIAAGLAAWPGMEIELVGVEEDYLILPLPQENTND